MTADRAPGKLMAGAQKPSARLSREEVQALYSPKPDPLWTAEVEAAFFAGLRRGPVAPCPRKAGLLRVFAAETLKAQRMSSSYVATLGAVLGKFAGADRDGAECLVSQRDPELGTPRTLRTLQAQMVPPGLLVKETRSQGRGFVGEIYVYKPSTLRLRAHRVRVGQDPEAVEKALRAYEGEASYAEIPSAIQPAHVCY